MDSACSRRVAARPRRGVDRAHPARPGRRDGERPSRAAAARARSPPTCRPWSTRPSSAAPPSRAPRARSPGSTRPGSPRRDPRAAAAEVARDLHGVGDGVDRGPRCPRRPCSRPPVGVLGVVAGFGALLALLAVVGTVVTHRRAPAFPRPPARSGSRRERQRVPASPSSSPPCSLLGRRGHRRRRGDRRRRSSHRSRSRPSRVRQDLVTADAGPRLPVVAGRPRGRSCSARASPRSSLPADPAGSSQRATHGERPPCAAPPGAPPIERPGRGRPPRARRPPSAPRRHRGRHPRRRTPRRFGAAGAGCARDRRHARGRRPGRRRAARPRRRPSPCPTTTHRQRRRNGPSTHSTRTSSPCAGRCPPHSAPSPGRPVRTRRRPTSTSTPNRPGFPASVAAHVRPRGGRPGPLVGRSRATSRRPTRPPSRSPSPRRCRPPSTGPSAASGRSAVVRRRSELVGVYQPVDAADPTWAHVPTTLRAAADEHHDRGREPDRHGVHGAGLVRRRRVGRAHHAGACLVPGATRRGQRPGSPGAGRRHATVPDDPAARCRARRPGPPRSPPTCRRSSPPPPPATPRSARSPRRWRSGPAGALVVLAAMLARLVPRARGRGAAAARRPRGLRPLRLRALAAGLVAVAAVPGAAVGAVLAWLVGRSPLGGSGLAVTPAVVAALVAVGGAVSRGRGARPDAAGRMSHDVRSGSWSRAPSSSRRPRPSSSPCAAA